jgi:hypothetical protein
MSRVSGLKRPGVSPRDAPLLPPPVPQVSDASLPSRWIVTLTGQAGALLPAGAIGLTAVLSLRRLSDADTWWHLAAGRWIAENHAIPRTDTLSFTVPDHAWINLQWLFDVFIYTLFRTGGPRLLAAAGAAIYTLGVALLVRNLQSFVGPIPATLLVLWSLAIAQGRFVIRPEMLSFLYLQLVLWICLTARPERARRLWLLPAVMLLWVNTHALFVIGIFVIGCYMLGSLGSRLPFLPGVWREAGARVPARRMLASGALAILAVLANPYGLDGALFPLKLMTRIDGQDPVFLNIGEFQRSFSPYYVTFAVRAYEVFFFFAGAVVLLAAAITLSASTRRPRPVARRERRRRQAKRDDGAPDRTGSAVAGEASKPGLDLAGLAVFLGLAYLSTLARRNMALFAMGSAPIVAQGLATLHPWVKRRWPAHRDLARAAVVLALLLGLVGIGYLVASNRFYRWDGQIAEFGTGVLDVSAPVGASAFAKAQRLPPLLFNDLTSGGYLAWDRPVDERVYIDGRLEVYDSAFFSRYLDLLRRPDQWQAEADRIGVQTVILLHVWSMHRPLIVWLLRDPRWALVYFDESAVVFLRQAGNEVLTRAAIGAFESRRVSTERALLEPPSSWQWPAGRARGLIGYGTMLDMMGRLAEAAPFFARGIEIGAPRNLEAGVALRLAQYHAGRNEKDLARAYLNQAAEVDPANPGIARLRNRIGP